jgi:hypothetical protein
LPPPQSKALVTEEKVKQDPEDREEEESQNPSQGHGRVPFLGNDDDGKKDRQARVKDGEVFEGGRENHAGVF